jgi:hypothetical protein
VASGPETLLIRDRYSRYKHGGLGRHWFRVFAWAAVTVVVAFTILFLLRSALPVNVWLPIPRMGW